MLLCTFCFVIVLFVSYVIACPDDWFFYRDGLRGNILSRLSWRKLRLAVLMGPCK